MLVGIIVVIAVRVTRLIGNEEGAYPRAIIKRTRSGKGLLLIVPDPVTNTSHTYVTSVAYMQLLLNGTLKGNMLGCHYLNEGLFEQFLTKDEKEEFKPNLARYTDSNPLGYKAQKERKEGELKNVDEW